MSEKEKKPNEMVPDEQCERHTRSEKGSESEGNSLDWEEVSSDPDPQELGYEISQWQRIPRPDETRIILLPTDEELLHDRAFVILDKNSLCDLARYR